ncbi:MAG TPA: ATP-binding protein [Terriglobales bacterium]|nr:ATP-binding protein [Terriglobales bacterium]
MEKTVEEKDCMEILLVASEERKLASLQKSLAHCGGERVHLDFASSCDQARQRIIGGTYDFVLCDLVSCEEECSADEKGRLVFLGDKADESEMQHKLQSVFCNRLCGRRGGDPCVALAVVTAVANSSKEKQRQSTEELLHKLRHTVEQSPDSVMITDRSGVLEYVNPAFENITGFAREEVVGETLGILKSEQQPGELYEEMWDTVVSGKVFHGIVVNRKKNGESFVMEKTITPMRNSDGEITHFISTGRDITTQRRLELQLQQAQKMDGIGRLAGGVAHDFNNLLMVISAYAELTLDALPEEDRLRNNVSEILTAARRAADLTRQLLVFSRKQMQSLQLLDLNSVLQDINRMLPRLIGEDVQFAFAPASGLDKVKADPVQIEQIVLNLAANARDAMPRGGKLTIETANVHLDERYVQAHSMVPLGDYVMLAVSDSGEGIPAEHLTHIFEPFYTTKEEGHGTGLGLATVYGIVKQNGGFIWVYSEPGMGTTFKIYLPKAESQKAKQTKADVDQDSPQGHETLLLVEDESPVRQSTRDFLTRNGYTVLEAQNGEEALRVSREYCGPVHLLISDVVMPKMSGPLLAEQLSAERPQMKTLFVSGYAESTVLQHGKIDVTARFLQKPFGLKALAQKVREVLDEKQPRARAASASE